MIQVLSQDTVGRISAGEVVERPSSIAKELLENALDAGATSVTVEIDGGGIALLRVTDNGSGIAPKEVRMAFENHATSKIKKAEDLDDLRTYGFRGEALPSIASVAKVEMTTRLHGAESGVRIRIEGGIVMDISEAGCPEGTTVIVRDLFFNTPVRQAFLKKPAYEAGVVIDMVQKMMLGNPNVSIRLISSKKTIAQTYGDGNLRHGALCVYGRETASRMIEVDEMEGGLRLKGMIGVEDCAKTTRATQSFTINGRLVRCPLLTQVLEEACRGRVTIGMYPMCALQVTIPPHSVDVNVHPSKLEVRFRDEAAMRTSVLSLLQKALNPAPMFSTETVKPVPKPEIKKTVVQTQIPIPMPTPVVPVTPVKKPEPVQVVFPTIPAKPAPVLKEEPIPVVPEPKVEKEPPKLQYRVIGVLFDTYLLLETENNLVMIDQHAAHERILYEKLSKSLDLGIRSQTLLTPIVLNVTKKENAIIEEQKETLLKAGYEVEPFGETAVRILAVPFILGKAELAPLFMEMIETLDTLKNAELDKKRDQIIQMSCKKAVKGGDALKPMEIEALLQELQTTTAPTTCPHGRPVLRVFSKNDLERLFKRQQ